MKAVLQGLLVAFTVNKEDYLPVGVEIPDVLHEQKRQEYIQKGEGVVVSHVGDGVTFVKPGDRISLVSNARASKFTNPEGDFFYIIREAEIAFKISE